MTAAIAARFRLAYDAFQLDIDLNLPGSGICVIFGHSGSGKTTLLRCIAGLQQAPQAYLEINGQIWQDSAQRLFLPTYKRPLGYVFQEANLFPHLSVAGNLQFGLKRIGKSATPANLPHILELLGISHLLERMPERLSGGERQRVAIARALAMNPAILLMDEPLASLDFKRKQEILPFLQRLPRELNIPLLYVTHSQQEMAQLADHLLILDQGQVQACGSLPETLGRLDVSLAQQREASSVWSVTILAHDSEYFMTRVGFADGALDLPHIEAPVGTVLRIQIYARDVSIVLAAPTATSILNVLPATVSAMTDSAPGQSLIQLRVGSQTLLSLITLKSRLSLGLKPDMTVFAQIKATSLLN